MGELEFQDHFAPYFDPQKEITVERPARRTTRAQRLAGRKVSASEAGHAGRKSIEPIKTTPIGPRRQPVDQRVIGGTVLTRGQLRLGLQQIKLFAKDAILDRLVRNFDTQGVVARSQCLRRIVLFRCPRRS